MTGPVPGKPLLSVRDLVLGYGRSEAVKGVSLDVHAGTVVTLIGANGAGKTTIRGVGAFNFAARTSPALPPIALRGAASCSHPRDGRSLPK